VTLADLRFRKGARLIYEYDLNIPWRHEVRIEDRLEREARKIYPVCTGGEGCGYQESHPTWRKGMNGVSTGHAIRTY
jgi:Plasmid pRiA4b ORF-3-like protein